MTLISNDLFRPPPLWRTAQIDPPWNESGGGKIKRGADKHYPLMEVGDIADALLHSGVWHPFEDAHLWCWYTDNFLADALQLTDKLGFRYVRQFVWVKTKGTTRALDFETGSAVEGLPEPRMSLGQYGRGAHESMLFCVRGRGLDPSVMTARRDIPSVFHAPVPSGDRGVRIHSRKPEAAYELIEARSKGPYLECFARRGRPGWQVWGNEAPAVAEASA